MTDQRTHPLPSRTDGEVSLISLAVLVLRRRRLIIVLAILGAVAGLTIGLVLPRTYRSTAVFIPQEQESGASGLAAAASQFGLNVPGLGGTWGPSLYAELLQSRAILDSIATATFPVAELERTVAVADLFEVDAPSEARRVELTARALRRRIEVSKEDDIGAVRVSIVTRWPDVSYAIVRRLVDGVNRFNIQIRNSQAGAERAFVEGQVAEAEVALRNAEDRLQSFLQANRMIQGSPELTFTRDRLQRDVMLRQEMHMTWLKSREDARIREVRNTPVITVLEEPRLPTVNEPRKIALKTILGLVLGGGAGVAWALVAGWLASLRGTPNPEEREFFELASAAVPSLPWRRRRQVVNS
jgi:uncharacterized protein involved in exopolysaccharide biosynthesis